MRGMEWCLLRSAQCFKSVGFSFNSPGLEKAITLNRNLIAHCGARHQRRVQSKVNLPSFPNQDASAPDRARASEQWQSDAFRAYATASSATGTRVLACAWSFGRILRRARADLSDDLLAGFGRCGLEIVVCLQIHPELCAGAEEAPETQRGLGADAAPAGENLGDAIGRHLDLGGEGIRRKP